LGSDWRLLIIAFISIVVGATGQFLFRVGMLKYGAVSALSIWGQLFKVVFTPAIFMGFICFAISAVLWLVVISRWELSYAYPMVALGYVIAIFYGAVFLKEDLSVAKLLGSLLILAGISILGLFGKS